LDLELAFTTREEVMDVLERVVVASFEAVGRPAPERPFHRLSYADAMLRYGSDKPDTRFGVEIQDATDVTRGSEFGVFKNAECVRFLVAPAVFSRAELQRLEEFAKEWGAKGLAYLVVEESGEVRSPIAKFLSADELAAFAAPPGSTVLFAADTQTMVERVLGALRSGQAEPIRPPARRRRRRRNGSPSLESNCERRRSKPCLKRIREPPMKPAYFRHPWPHRNPDNNRL